MGNVIMIAVIVVAVLLGVRSSIRHFKGEGGCCGGGGDVKPKRKKLPKVLFTRTFRVEGMHCDHCKNRVEAAVNDLDGVAGKVSLKKGVLTVSYAEQVEDAAIIAAIGKAGYTATAQN